MCSFIWAIFFFWSPTTYYIVRGGAIGTHQGGATQLAVLWCSLWGRGPRGNSATCPLCWLSVTFPTTHSQIGPFWCGFPVGRLVYVLGPCGSLQRTLLWGWEFLLLLPQPPQVFSTRGLRLYLSELEPWVSRSVSLPSCSSRFTCMQMWDRWVLNPPPCRRESSPPLLPVWMNVSSLTPWLSDFHTVRFSVSSGWFLFLNLLSLFWLCGRHSVSTYTSILAGSSILFIN